MDGWRRRRGYKEGATSSIYRPNISLLALPACLATFDLLPFHPLNSRKIYCTPALTSRGSLGRKDKIIDGGGVEGHVAVLHPARATVVPPPLPGRRSLPRHRCLPPGLPGRRGSATAPHAAAGSHGAHPGVHLPRGDQRCQHGHQLRRRPSRLPLWLLRVRRRQQEGRGPAGGGRRPAAAPDGQEQGVGGAVAGAEAGPHQRDGAGAGAAAPGEQDAYPARAGLHQRSLGEGGAGSRPGLQQQQQQQQQQEQEEH